MEKYIELLKNFPTNMFDYCDDLAQKIIHHKQKYGNETNVMAVYNCLSKSIWKALYSKRNTLNLVRKDLYNQCYEFKESDCRIMTTIPFKDLKLPKFYRGVFDKYNSTKIPESGDNVIIIPKTKKDKKIVNQMASKCCIHIDDMNKLELSYNALKDLLNVATLKCIPWKPYAETMRCGSVILALELQNLLENQNIIKNSSVLINYAVPNTTERDNIIKKIIYRKITMFGDLYKTR